MQHHPKNPHRLPPRWREQYEERAAIMEHDGGLERAEAEAAALHAVRLAMIAERLEGQLGADAG